MFSSKVMRAQRASRFAYIAASLGAVCMVPSVASADIQNYADAFTNYSPGTGVAGAYADPAAATLGLNGDTSYGGLNPFNPPFNPGDIAIVGGGGELTLHMALPVPTNGFNLGVYSNNGMVDVSSDGSGQADSAADLFSAPSQAIVSVSHDGVNFVTLNQGAPITFDAPTNYYLESEISGYFQPLGTVAANQSQPWLGNLSSLSNKTYDQIKQSFNGSAGGNWLDLSSSKLPDISYVRFDVPAGDSRLAIDSVGALHEAAAAIAGEAVITDSVGAGANTSVICVDFGPQSYDFDVHYDAAISGEQAIQLLAQDTDLGFSDQHFGFGDFLTELKFGGYDLSGNGAGGSGFWKYYLSTDGLAWKLSGQGFSSRMLSNGSYDGWLFSTSGPSLPSQPTAVPEPAAAALMMLASGALLARRSRRVERRA